MFALLLILLALIVIPVIARRVTPASAATAPHDRSVDRVAARADSNATAAPNQMSALR